MKNLSIILITGIFVLLLIPANAHSKDKAQIHLLDLSGSVTDCEDVFMKNLGIIKTKVTELNKKSKIIVLGFGYKGKLSFIVNDTMPSRTGGKGRKLTQKREEILKAIAEFFKNTEIDNKATDVLGALQQVGLIVSQLKERYDIELTVFSDGKHNLGIKNSNGNDYVASLIKYLRKEKINEFSNLKIMWYGDSCSENVSHSEFSRLQDGVRNAWIYFLSEQDVRGIKYHLLYN